MYYLIFIIILMLFTLLCFSNLNLLIKKILITIPIENFENKFIPNKIFQHNGKIYILDNKNVLKNNVNPLVFDTFQEYQKFIINVKNDINKDYDFIKKFKIKNIKNIDNLKFNYLDKNNNDFNNFNVSQKCNKYASECSANIKKPFIDESYDINTKTPFIDNIYSKNKQKFIERKCNIPIFDKKFCKDLENLYKNEKKYKDFCIKNSNNNTCKKINLIKYNSKIVEKACVNKKKNFDDYKNICLLEDFFKENMLSYDF